MKWKLVLKKCGKLCDRMDGQVGTYNPLQGLKSRRHWNYKVTHQRSVLKVSCPWGTIAGNWLQVLSSALYRMTSTLQKNLKAWYCKRGYFRWGKISWKCLQDSSPGGNFYDTPISFVKAYGFYFCVGVIFVKKTKVQKNTQKLPPRKNVHVYSKYMYIILCL